MSGEELARITATGSTPFLEGDQLHVREAEGRAQGGLCRVRDGVREWVGPDAVKEDPVAEADSDMNLICRAMGAVEQRESGPGPKTSPSGERSPCDLSPYCAASSRARPSNR